MKNLFKLNPRAMWTETEFPRHLYMDLNGRQFTFDLAESIQESILKKNKIENYAGIKFLCTEDVLKIKRESIGKDMVFIQPYVFFEKIQNQFFAKNKFYVIDRPPLKLFSKPAVTGKFTQGPWKVLCPSKGVDLNWHVTDDNDTFVAHVYGFNHSINEQSLYNAQLISCAPELLEVLCLLLLSLNDNHGFSSEELDYLPLRAMVIRDKAMGHLKDMKDLLEIHQKWIRQQHYVNRRS